MPFTIQIFVARAGLGTLMTSAVATGRKNQLEFEVNGSLGSIYFNFENLNILSVYIKDNSPKNLRGFSQINVTEDSHPLTKYWCARNGFFYFF
jgi:hypothetical protein